MNRVRVSDAIQEALRARYIEVADELGCWCHACGVTAFPNREERAVCNYCKREPEPGALPGRGEWTWKPERNGLTLERNGQAVGSVTWLVDLATPTLTAERIAAVMNRDGQA